ncbi:MAG: hypothetical protein KGL39_34725 [Patescibacteria group bacterium]|nr:hypothetical protein [Patescibacteria group bacterium]
MSTTIVREYADIAVTFGKYLQAGAEPALTDQALTTGASSVPSAAFSADTRIIAISTPPSNAVACVFGNAPVATASNLRLPANSLLYFGVRPGQQVAFIEVT